MKGNLVKRLTSILLVYGTLATFTACGDTKNYDISEANKELTAALASDSDVFVFDTYYFNYSTFNNEYLVDFRIHYDEGRELNKDKTDVKKYKGHKDYKVCYSISRDDYYSLISFFRDFDNKNNVREFSDDQIYEIKKIVDKYDPTGTYELGLEFYDGCRY